MVILSVNFVVVMKPLTISFSDVFMLNKFGCGWEDVDTAITLGLLFLMLSYLPAL